MTKTLTSLAIAMVLSLGVSARAAGPEFDVKDLGVVAQVGSVTITEVTVPQAHINYFNAQALKLNNLSLYQNDMTGVDIAGWVAIGKQIWDIVLSMSGKMVIEPMNGVGVIPSGADALLKMSDWKSAKPKSYRMEIKGYFRNAFRYDYTVGFTYNGRYQGKGQFLANVAVIPFNVKCGWTYDCKANVNVGMPFNAGHGNATIAALPVDMIVNIQGKLNAKAAGVRLVPHGDGRLEQMVTQE